MKAIHALAGIVLCAQACLAQNVPPPPNPDTGPTLEFTMKFIQDQLTNRGVVSYRDKTSADDDGIRYVNRILEVHTDPATCSLSFRVDQTSSYDIIHKSTGEVARTYTANTTESFRFSFHDIAKLEVRDSDHPVIPDHSGSIIDPTLYTLMLTPSKAAIDHGMHGRLRRLPLRARKDDVVPSISHVLFRGIRESSGQGHASRRGALRRRPDRTATVWVLIRETSMKRAASFN
jgi:hypothetical protein